MVINESEINRMKKCLSQIPDPRRESGNFRHKLMDILLIGLCVIIIGEDEYEVMEDWALEWESWLRGFLELPNGIPSKDTFRRLFERIEPAALLTSLNAWLGLQRQVGGREINIDGKTIRGSGKKGEHEALHILSAWVGEQDLVLGQLATDEKSNEITAIPQVLELLDIQGDVVTIDAMGCQKAIVEQIRNKQADYVVAVKENQPALYQDIVEYFEYLEENPCEAKADGQWRSDIEKDHGRIERRSVTTVTALDWLESRQSWKDINTLIRYTTSRTIGDQSVITHRYYISSMKGSAETFGTLIRGHWSIENRLHWSLDVTFREDDSRKRKDRAPENMNILRKIALRLLRAASVPERKLSTRRKSFKASINPQFLLKVLFGF